jgi:fructan beta-fructosidase
MGAFTAIWRTVSTRSSWLALAGAWLVAGASLRADEPSAGVAYDEALRPQFHVTSVKDWINDPNGMVYFEGEYHLFFQRDPTAINGSAYKSWAHSIGTDLVHWKQLDDAISPDELGSMWSGSGVVDWHNTSRLQTGDEPTLVLIYTAAGGMLDESKDKPFTQCIAFSNDRGRTWTKYEGNPVVQHIEGGNRDPKVVWHEPTRRWIMSLYLDGDRFALLASPDLQEWTRLQEVRVPGSSECPDFFEIPVEGEPGVTRWVFWTANNAHLVGTFDGQKFVAEGEPQRSDAGDCYYAAQTFSDIPKEDGRRVQIAWMRGDAYPGMPFNQQLGLPTVLTLHREKEGLRLRRLPVRELETLRQERHEWQGELDEGVDPLAELDADTFEIRATIDPAHAESVMFKLRGVPLEFDATSGRLILPKAEAVVPMVDGNLQLHIFVDRTSIEVFTAEGRVTLAQCYLPGDDVETSLTALGANVESLQWWTLRSIWEDGAR